VHEIIEIKPVVQDLVQPPKAPVVPDVPLPERKPKITGKVVKGPVPWWKIW
jgi:hypothetical protein